MTKGLTVRYMSSADAECQRNALKRLYSENLCLSLRPVVRETIWTGYMRPAPYSLAPLLLAKESINQVQHRYQTRPLLPDDQLTIDFKLLGQN